MSRLRSFAKADRGAAATIVVLLMATGVLLGMTALVVDVGRLHIEREELQSGADSAATKVAMDCAKRRIACTTQGLANSEISADANAKDNRSNVLEFCGWARTITLPVCTEPAHGNLTDCLGAIPPGVNYIQVRTRTEVAEGDYILPFALAQTLAGTGAGATVAACSRVAYGPPKSGLALTIAACEWDRAKPSTVLPPPWPPDPPAGKEVALGVHSGAARTCTIGPPSGWDQPGGFGWLDETGGKCLFAMSANLDYGGDTGTSPSKNCVEALEDLRTSHQVVAMPIYDGQQGTGSNAEYHLYKMAAFVVTGYSVGKLKAASNVHPTFDPCGGDDKCVYGYFVDVEFIDGDVGPDPGTNLGLMTIKTIG
jgi:Putative Flp pilus-assembly TadE/G-like